MTLQGRANPLARGFLRGSPVDAEERSEKVEDGPQRRRPAISRGACFQDRDPGGAATLEKLEDETALAAAGFADHADHGRMPCARVIHRPSQRREFTAAADERTELLPAP